jgi:glycosyltransferase involved in cell wall biosynthesis
MNLEDNIFFKGHVNNEEIKSYYSSCRAFIFPSHIETFGNSLLEAMASGAPIACSQTAAMPEIIGEAGLFYDPNDEYDMAKKIEQLIENDELCKKLGDKALRRANNFQWDKTALKTIDVIIKAVGLKSNTHKRPL